MEESTKKPIRILHVINKFDVGGVETWLLNVVKRLSREKYQFDFFCVFPSDELLEKEILSFGCYIFKGSAKRCSVVSILRDLKAVVNKTDSYDVIHSHVHYFSGVIVLVGFILGIPVRIVHSHNDTRSKERSAGIMRRIYVGLMRIVVRLFATSGIGVSRDAAEDQFGIDWAKDPRWRIFPCGIDFSSFDIPKDELLPLSLGIPAGVKVIGHIGRFDTQKNHFFLIDVFKKLLDRKNNVFLVLVGEGNLKKAVEEHVDSLGISDRVIFLGVRRDVPNLLKSVVDVFLFPSLYEGLGLVFIEAQLAGCYCVGSDNLPKEVVLDQEKVVLFSLEAPVDVWVKGIEEVLFIKRREGQNLFLTQAETDYEIRTNIRKLLSLYTNGAT